MKNGKTLYDTYEIYSRTPPEHDELPFFLYWLWDCFWQISGQKQSLANPITFQEIYYWCKLNKLGLSNQQVLGILQMDKSLVKSINEQQKKNQPKITTNNKKQYKHTGKT